MSRVDDDRDAARIAAKQIEARRMEEKRKTGKAIENSAFSKMVSGQKEAAQNTQQQKTNQQQSARSAIASLLEQTEVPGNSVDSHHPASQQSEQTGFKGSLLQKMHEKSGQVEIRSGKEKESVVQNQSADGKGLQEKTNQKDDSVKSRNTEIRKSNSDKNSEVSDERAQASDSAGAVRAGNASKGKGELKSDGDQGGQGQGGKEQKGSPAANPGFRFNPALMAPMAVAKQKDVSGSERLRKIANELAQKIVENVRVGTNALGRSEFQIDLRGNVLAGLSVKISSHQGKIKAVFSGKDQEILKLIEAHREELQNALKARGLSLEDFKIEGIS